MGGMSQPKQQLPEFGANSLARRMSVCRDVGIHKHPEDHICTVMSGVFYFGLGETFEGDKVKAYPPGSVIVLPGETWDFHWAKSGEYVTRVTAIGALGLEYHDLHDDPRRQRVEAASILPASEAPVWELSPIPTTGFRASAPAQHHRKRQSARSKLPTTVSNPIQGRFP
jgi:hypothetical protein